MKRRSFLKTSGVILGTLSLAGCLNDEKPKVKNGVSKLPRPYVGEENAKVTIEVFEDYKCPHCKMFNTEIYPEIYSEYIKPHSVRFEHYDWPIPVHDPMSYRIAMGARSVQDREGMSKFWEFSKLAFENQSELNETSDITTLAQNIGADKNTVLQDIKDNRYRPVVNNDKEIGNKKGVEATPTVFINGAKTRPRLQFIKAELENYF